MSSVEGGKSGGSDFWLPLELWAQALERLNVCMVAIDSRGRLTKFNKMAERISGYSRAEVLGRSGIDVLLAPEERKALQEAFEDLLAEAAIHQKETYWMTKEGGRRRVHCILASHRGFNHNGEEGEAAQAVVGLGIDVTGGEWNGPRKRGTDESESRRGFEKLASNLAGASMMASALVRRVERGEAATAEQLRQLAKLVGEITDEFQALLLG